MIFQVQPACLELGLRAGAILFRDLAIGPRSPELHAEIAQAVAAVRAGIPDVQTAAGMPEIAAFLEILRRVGVNPRKTQHSVEKLVAFALKRGDLPTINNFVDAYNMLSLKSLCSLGAHDVDRLRWPVILRLLDGTESFTPLGRTEPTPVQPGEFGYVAADNRLLCRLDVLQADFSKVTETTRSALLIIESTTAHAPAAVQELFEEAMRCLPRFCGGKGEIVAR